MSLILALGSNQGDKKEFINLALEELSKNWKLIARSNFYESKAVDYTDQDDFINLAAEFTLPHCSPKEALNIILEIEKKMGRVRTINKGPRMIDIDIIFWGTQTTKQNDLTIPHPAWDQRSFVCLPIRELPYFETLKDHFIFPEKLNNEAFVSQ